MKNIEILLAAALTLISIPIMLLNFGGGIVAGIWLIFLGRWAFVISLVALSVLSTWILSILIFPSFIFAAPTLWAVERKKYILATALGTVASLWTYVVMSFWCIASFGLVLSNYTGSSILPYALAAYALSVGPWTYMASQERYGSSHDTDFSATEHGALFVCLGSVVMLIFTLCKASFGEIAFAFIVIATIGWFLQALIVAWKLQRSKSEMLSASRDIDDEILGESSF